MSVHRAALKQSVSWLWAHFPHCEHDCEDTVTKDEQPALSHAEGLLLFIIHVDPIPQTLSKRLHSLSFAMVAK